MWAWGLADTETPEAVEFGTDIDSFIERISETNSICYFHNLKFDGHFILDWLLNNDFEHMMHKGTNPATFSTLISDSGKFYSMTVRWANGTNTEFRDSVKKLPMTVRRIATSFGYAEGKGDIDYQAFRPIGYMPTEEEWDYVRRDVSIVAKAIKQTHDNGMKRLTVASDALAEYKTRLRGKFDALFPVLGETMDTEIRRAYRGGFTYADPRHKGRIVGSGLVLDVNSLYPFIMRSRMLPYGMPVYEDGMPKPSEEYPLVMFSVTFTARLKPDHIPCIQIKGNSPYSQTEYLRIIDEPVNLMVTNVDWQLYQDHYDIEVLELLGGWKFRAAEGMFDNYVDHWSRVKEHSKHGIREIAKLHLNSLYGKFASNPNVTSKYPVLEDGIVKLRRGPDETRPPIYTAVGVFITSWARELTIRAAQRNYHVFAYADTDSLHLLTDTIPEELDVHPSRMGAWKLEYRFDSAFYIRSKAYLERARDGYALDGSPLFEFVNRIAGVPEAVSGALTFADLKPGTVLRGKLAPKVVPGGVVLVDVPFDLKLDSED